MAELSADNTGVTCTLLVLPFTSFPSASYGARHTVRPSNLAPDHPDVGTPDLTLCPVDKSNLLAQVEAIHRLAICPLRKSPPRYSLGGVSVVNTVDLDQTCVRVDLVLRALVAQVTTPGERIALIVVPVVSFRCPRFLPNDSNPYDIHRLCATSSDVKTIRNNLLNVNCDQERKTS